MPSNSEMLQPHAIKVACGLGGFGSCRGDRCCLRWCWWPNCERIQLQVKANACVWQCRCDGLERHPKRCGAILYGSAMKVEWWGDMVLVAPRLLIVINYFFCLFVRVFFFYVYLDCRLNIYIYSWTHAFIKSGAKGGELQQLSNIEYICDFEYMYIYIYVYVTPL